MSITALKQALEALEWIVRVNAMDYEYKQKAAEPIPTLRQAIKDAEKPPIYVERATTNYEDGWEEGFKAGSLSKQIQKQEPYGWVHAKVSGTFYKEKPRRIHTTPVYTAPPKQAPDDLLRQSEREGWRYAKECETEIKRLKELAEYRLQLLMKMPEQKEWVGLTDVEVGKYSDRLNGGDIAKEVEAKLKERNT